MNRGQLTLVARLHAEKVSRSEESHALSETQEALAKAHESIVQLGSERDAERRLRLDAEAKVRAERHARQAAMRLLQHATQALRKLKSDTAQRERDARAYSQLQADHQVAEAELRELDTALRRAVEHGERFKSLAEAARLAREAAEEKAATEQHAREEALQALARSQQQTDEQWRAAEHQAKAYAALEVEHRRVMGELAVTQLALQSAFSATTKLEAELAAEREAREAHERRARAEQHAREQAARRLRETELEAEHHARAHAAVEKRRREAAAQMKEIETALVQAEYDAHRAAQDCATLRAALTAERRARETAEHELAAAREALEAQTELPQRPMRLARRLRRSA